MTNIVSIPVGDGEFKDVDAILLAQYYSEASESYRAVDNGKELLKSTLETASEVLGIKKGILSKFMKARYEAKIKEASELTKTINALDEAMQ